MPNQISEQVGAFLPKPQRRSFLRRALTMAPAALAAASLPGTVAAANGTTPFFFNVNDEYAASPGISDTAAIQSAINKAIAAGGGVVLIPAGTYVLTASLVVDSVTLSTPVTLQGVGAGPGQTGAPYAPNTNTTLKVDPAATFDAIVASNSDSVTIRSLTILSASARASGCGIKLSGATNVLVEDVILKNQNVGIYIKAGYCHRINRGQWGIPPSGIGLWVDGDSISGAAGESNDTFVSGISASGGWAAFRIQHTGGLWLTECDSILSTFGLLIDPLVNQKVLWSTIESCDFDTASSATVRVIPAGGIIRGLVFNDCWTSSITSSSGNCMMIAGDVDGIQIIGQRLFNNAGGHGLWVSGAKNVYVDSSVASGNINGIGFCFVSTTNFAIRNCHSGPYAGFAGNQTGVYIDAGCSRYVVQGSTFNGNGTALTDLGAAPKSILAGSNILT